MERVKKKAAAVVRIGVRGAEIPSSERSPRQAQTLFRSATPQPLRNIVYDMFNRGRGPERPMERFTTWREH